jgi:uncharacterized protein
MTEFAPVSTRERLRTLDVLRGCALLGILLMNIPSFAMPESAYMRLNDWGGNDGANLWTFLVQWVLFDGKMRALFSMLFGAGIIIFVDRATAWRDSVRVGDLFVRRMLWLMLFGILHAWFIWFGDILYPYAICGLLIFPLRTLAPRQLFTIAAAALLLLTFGIVGSAFSRQEMRQQAVAAMEAEAKGVTLTDKQVEAKNDWAEVLEEQEPSREEMQKEVDDYRSGYAGAMRQRAAVNREWQFVPLYSPGFFDSWALMLIGMGLYKLGILQGNRSADFYVRMALIAYGIALPLNIASAYFLQAWHFDIVGNQFASAPYQVGRVAMVLGHLSAIVLVLKRGWLEGFVTRLAAVGQMALSNYISHSVICSLIFYSPGLALIGQLQRYQFYFVVLGIWAFNLVWSPWWLARYRFGPLEWCWRSLTYWHRQPMLRDELVPASAVFHVDRVD